MLTPSSDGEIAEIFFAFPRSEVLGNSGFLRRLMAIFPPRIDISVLTHAASAPAVRHLIDEARPGGASRVIPVPDGVRMSAWLQDRCLLGASISSRKPLVLLSKNNTSVLGGSMAGVVAKALGTAPPRRTDVPFTGGNVLVGDDFVLLGSDIADELTARDSGSCPVADTLDCQRRPIFVGAKTPVYPFERKGFSLDARTWWVELINYGAFAHGTRQPVYHLDMYLTLAGRDPTPPHPYRILVGDPLAAARLMGRDLPEHVNQNAFDEVAKLLTEKGFAVIRNPLAIVPADDARVKLRRWIVASHNNCLVETRPGGPGTVWLPCYGFGAWEALSAVDSENVRIWRALGFDVIDAGDFCGIAKRYGGLHCLLKAFRAPPPGPQ